MRVSLSLSPTAHICVSLSLLPPTYACLSLSPTAHIFHFGNCDAARTEFYLISLKRFTSKGTNLHVVVGFSGD